jgi:CheY-like chemotaxis protein/anti-sigma regulatory factor (Ser/Thr protein kinase)
LDAFYTVLQLLNTIITDKTRLYKIISNLIQNALKFTVEGSIEIGCSMVDEVVQVYVKDTGVGIQKEMLTKIFERFTQEEESLSRKYGGLGLGLSIVKENAEIIKASIDVKSEKGKGSTFLVNIPYKPCLQTAKKFKSKNRIQQQTDKPYKIVIAEDADMNFIYLQMLLKKQDFNLEIHRAKNGLEAVELCRKHPNLDMLLMDIEMPKMDGYTAARNIRKENRLLKIIAQSAHAGSKDIHKAKELGFNDFIPKPIEEEKLLGILEKYLKQTSTTTSKQKLNS